jgi:UDPglucose 6-dehydrogenase
MKITIFGSGYVGLVTGACLADVGHDVICADIDATKIAKLNLGEVPIYEPGLASLIGTNVSAARLGFTTDMTKAVAHGDVLFIAVGTPSDVDGSADLKQVLAVARTIGENIGRYKVVVTKSTVPVGTTHLVAGEISDALGRRGNEITFDVCSNPEFLKEGAAIEDFTKAARIVIGTENPKALQVMRQVYGPYNRNHDKIIAMDIRSSELTKYASNAMLATKISFMNELANIAEKLGADIERVRIGMGSDPRIGFHFIYPGCGFGGSCFPKDIRALAKTARDNGVTPHVLDAVQSVNVRQKHRLFEKLSEALQSDLNGRTIAVWGLAFKPNTDDMREAPSLTLIDELLAAGATIRAHDPEASAEARRMFAGKEGISICDTFQDALNGSDALVICTEWKIYRTVDPELIRTALKSPIVIDGRNLYEQSTMQEAGLLYHSVGRPTLPPQ